MYNIKSMTLDKYEMSFGVDFRMRQRGGIKFIVSSLLKCPVFHFILPI